MEFLAGKSQKDYTTDKALRAMVERKLFVVGEAVTQLKNASPEVAARLPDMREVVGFRNLLAHGYFALDHRRVYDVACSALPVLLAAVEVVIRDYA